MSQIRRFATAGLDDAAGRRGHRGGLAVGAIDETSQEKAGGATEKLPASDDKAMSFPEEYRYEDADQVKFCLEQMRRHLRLLPLRRNPN
jgi:hypothetical protein